MDYPDCEESSGARLANASEPSKPQVLTKEIWSIDIFPNPATNQITLVNKNETDLLTISIKDVAGRIVLLKHLKTEHFFVNLDLSLINGAYFATITNNKNESITKKLLIAK